MKVQLTKIPSVVRRLHLPQEVEVGVAIEPVEGAVLVVEALTDVGKNNMFEFTSGRIGFLVEGDIIPAVLGRRQALREYSGDIPEYVDVGDILYLLCESGVVGEIRGTNEAYGAPLQVRVLGSVIAEGKQVNIKDVAIERKPCLDHSVPIVCVMGTSMSIGKTTAICKLIQHFRRLGLKVASVKLSGIASTQDPDKVSDAGAYLALSLMDGGLPSTCGDAQEVVEVALGLLYEANSKQADLIIAEFGDGILGGYHVDQLLVCPDIQCHICSFIVATGDFVAAWGAKELLRQYGITITAITGPVANNETGAFYVEQHLHIPAESNQHAMLKILRLVEEHVQQARMRFTA